jgi:hypothetical protein
VQNHCITREKSVTFIGGFAPLTPTRGSAPGPRWGPTAAPRPLPIFSSSMSSPHQKSLDPRLVAVANQCSVARCQVLSWLLCWLLWSITKHVFCNRPQLELFTTLHTRRRFSYLTHTQLKQTNKVTRTSYIQHAIKKKQKNKVDYT